MLQFLEHIVLLIFNLLKLMESILKYREAKQMNIVVIIDLEVRIHVVQQRIYSILISNLHQFNLYTL